MDDVRPPGRPTPPMPGRTAVDGFGPMPHAVPQPSERDISATTTESGAAAVEVAEKQDVVPVAIAPNKEPENKPEELIPGLNTKPSSDSFNETPRPSLTDTRATVKKPETDDQPLQTKPSKQPTKKGKGAAIFVAILFALALIGGAGYAYWQKKNEQRTPAANTTQESTKSPAKADDVEKVSNDIDESLKKIDDTKDYQESDLSDETLGL